jgi:hypothetical protein
MTQEQQLTKFDWSRANAPAGGYRSPWKPPVPKPPKPKKPLRVDYKYLVCKNPAKKAHVWVDEDSACHMWGAGGIQNRADWAVAEMHGGRAICQTCTSVMGMGSSKVTLS